MNNNTNNGGIAGLTQEMIDVAIANPGTAIIPSDYEQPSVSSPRQQVPLRGYGKQLRPNVEGNSPMKDGLVSGPSAQFTKNLISSAQEEAKAALQQMTDRQEEKESLSNKALRRDLEAMRRQVKRLEKTIKELTQ